MAAAEEIEMTLFLARNVHVFKVPTLTGSGYKAGEWRDHLWDGRLAVVSKGDGCVINLTDSSSGELFAACPVRKGATGVVTPVLDSSRFFVLRIEHENQHAFIGIGFDERSEAFDFNVALQDQKRWMEVSGQPPKEDVPTDEFRLKEGETLKINIASKKKTSGGSNSGVGVGGASGSGGSFLPPPPSATRGARSVSGSGAPANAFLPPPPSTTTATTTTAPADNSKSVQGQGLFGGDESWSDFTDAGNAGAQGASGGDDWVSFE